MIVVMRMVDDHYGAGCHHWAPLLECQSPKAPGLLAVSYSLIMRGCEEGEDDSFGERVISPINSLASNKPQWVWTLKQADKVGVGSSSTCKS